MRKLATWIGSFIVIAAITLCLFEFTAKHFIPKGLKPAFVGDRYSFVSPGAYVSHDGYFAYKPLSDIREITYYPDTENPTPHTKLTREYDCSYHSDALGFLDNVIPYQNAHILLVGDSVTEGEGGCAWVPSLPDALRQQIYSVAIMGQGIFHWKNIVAALDSTRHVQKMVIIFISGDFFRPAWMIDQQQLDCLDGITPCYKNFMYPIEGDLDMTALQRYILRTNTKFFPDIPLPKPPRPRPHSTVQNSNEAPPPFSSIMLDYIAQPWNRFISPRLTPLEDAVLSFMQRYMPATMNLYGRTIYWLEQSSKAAKGVAILDELARTHDITLIRVETKDEAANDGAYNMNTRALMPELSHYKVHNCMIPSSGFLPRDGHPNAEGYALLRACVTPILQEVAAAP